MLRNRNVSNIQHDGIDVDNHFESRGNKLISHTEINWKSTEIIINQRNHQKSLEIIRNQRNHQKSSEIKEITRNHQKSLEIIGNH
jgi:hypothetical protein